MVTLTRIDAEELVIRALVTCGTAPSNACSVAAALVAAEIDGQVGHGLSRVLAYAAQVKSGKVDGSAVPVVIKTRAATLQIDANGGFAYPALDLAVEKLPAMARSTGVASGAIFRSHHIGQAGRAAERLADQGLLALVVSNTPRAMAFPGGKRPMLGTNPLAFAAPLTGRPALVIDLALSLVARGRIIGAQKAGEPIPVEWATDSDGLPTSDPSAALAGALTPIGGPKGAALALVVEILCGALAGGHYGWEASSFLDDRGPSPAVGQLIIAFDPAAFGAGAFPQRMDDLLTAVATQPGVRLPGERRLINRERARQGFTIEQGLYEQIQTLSRPGANT